MPAPITSRRSQTHLDLLSERQFARSVRSHADSLILFNSDPSPGPLTVTVPKRRLGTSSFTLSLDLPAPIEAQVRTLGRRSGKSVLIDQLISELGQSSVVVSSRDSLLTPVRQPFDFRQGAGNAGRLLRRNLRCSGGLALDAQVLTQTGAITAVDSGSTNWPAMSRVVQQMRDGMRPGEVITINGRRARNHTIQADNAFRFWNVEPSEFARIRFMTEEVARFADHWVSTRDMGGDIFSKETMERLYDGFKFQLTTSESRRAQPAVPNTADLDRRRKLPVNLMNPEAVDTFVSVAWERVKLTSIYNKWSKTWEEKKLESAAALYSGVIRNWILREGIHHQSGVSTCMNPIFKAADGRFHEWSTYNNIGRFMPDQRREPTLLENVPAWVEAAYSNGDNIRVFSPEREFGTLRGNLEPVQTLNLGVSEPDRLVECVMHAFWWLVERGQGVNDITRVTVLDAGNIWREHHSIQIREQYVKEANTGLGSITLLTYGKESMALVRMVTEDHLVAEGRLMDHCVGSHTYKDRMFNNGYVYYSIRDLDAAGNPTNPHVTIELKAEITHGPVDPLTTLPKPSVTWSTNSVKGRANHNNAKYYPWVKAAEKVLGVSISNCY